MSENALAMEFTIAGLVEATATVVPERPAITGDQGTLSYPELVDRSRRLARFLGDHGLGAYRDRDALRGHETGQHFLAQYLHNSPAYIEGLLGAFRSRPSGGPVAGRARRGWGVTMGKWVLRLAW